MDIIYGWSPKGGYVKCNCKEIADDIPYRWPPPFQAVLRVLGIVNMMRGAFIFLVFIWKPSIWRATKATHPKLAAAIAKAARHVLPREGRGADQSYSKGFTVLLSTTQRHKFLATLIEEIPLVARITSPYLFKRANAARSPGSMRRKG